MTRGPLDRRERLRGLAIIAVVYGAVIGLVAAIVFAARHGL